MRDAKRKFSKGDRVKMSRVGKRLLHEKINTGILHSFSPHNERWVYILRDGTKTPIRYHMDFWQKD